MEAGEKEMRRIFEDATSSNLKMVIDHVRETREMVEKSDKMVKRLHDMVIEQNKVIEMLKLQLSNVQVKLYSGGT